MKTKKKQITYRGVALITAMIFIVVFSAISIGFLSLGSANTQISANHRTANNAMNAALSGLDCARHVIYTVSNNNITSRTVVASVNNLEPEQAEISWYTPMWNALCTQLSNTNYGNKSVVTETLTVGGKTLYKATAPNITTCDGRGKFNIVFSRYRNDPNVLVQITGTSGTIGRTIQIAAKITPDSSVLNYGVASRGRIWLTGDTTIHGSVYSSYGYKSDGTMLSMSPFNMTSDSTVEGSFNTILPWQKINDAGYYELQTFEHDANGKLVLDDNKRVDNNGYLLDQNSNYVRDAGGNYVDVYTRNFTSANGQYTVIDGAGNPIEGFVPDGSGGFVSIGAITYGNPIEAFAADGSRIFSSGDELQGTYENANYNVPNNTNVPGLNIGDYNTSAYKNAIPTTNAVIAGSLIQNGKLSTSSVSYSIEYFPHATGSYTTRASDSSLPLKRYVYENKTIKNVLVSAGTNALFKNCTFEDVLYVDCNASGPTVSLPSSYTTTAINTFLSTTKNYNNIRFENCNFNGVIITNTPQALNTRWWMGNNLYFTGTASFDNNSSVKEATVLAPHFNVNLGNTNPDISDNNVLTGAIVGGIVDIRGNAQIYGTIISMADTSSYTSGYVSNIGATENDGGSETTEAGDIGTIEITPDPGNMLPSGITTPIVLKPQTQSYQECI